MPRPAASPSQCIQLVLGELGRSHDPHMRNVARLHAAMALGRAELALVFPPDLALLRRRHADYWAAG